MVRRVFFNSFVSKTKAVPSAQHATWSCFQRSRALEKTVSTLRRPVPVPADPLLDLQVLVRVKDAARIGQGLVASVVRLELPVTGTVAFKAQSPPSDTTSASHVSLQHFHANAKPQQLIDEANALWKLRHPHIVRLFKVCVDDGFQGLVLEYMGGGSLGALLHSKKTQ